MINRSNSKNKIEPTKFDEAVIKEPVFISSGTPFIINNPDDRRTIEELIRLEALYKNDN